MKSYFCACCYFWTMRVCFTQHLDNGCQIEYSALWNRVFAKVYSGFKLHSLANEVGHAGIYMHTNTVALTLINTHTCLVCVSCCFSSSCLCGGMLNSRLCETQIAHKHAQFLFTWPLTFFSFLPWHFETKNNLPRVNQTAVSTNRSAPHERALTN